MQILNEDNKVVAEFVTTRQAQNIVYSSSEIKTGAKYKIRTGDAESTVTAGEARVGFGRGGR